MRRSACAIRRRGILAVAGEQRDADASAQGPDHRDRLAGLGKLLDQFTALGVGKVTLVDALEQDGELVAAPARHGIRRPNHTDQTFGSHDQHAVTDFMAVAVVDRLEVVEVDEQQRAATVAAPAAGDGMGQALFQEPAIGEPGQAVVGREIEQLPGALIEQRQLLQEAHNLRPVRRSAGPHRPPAALMPRLGRAALARARRGRRVRRPGDGPGR